MSWYWKVDICFFKKDLRFFIIVTSKCELDISFFAVQLNHQIYEKWLPHKLLWFHSIMNDVICTKQLPISSAWKLDIEGLKIKGPKWYWI